jgi:hypothetical protein
VAGQLALAGSASATHNMASAGHVAGTIKPSKVNNLDCNGYSPKYKAAAPGMRALCTDPHLPASVYGTRDGQAGAKRFYDNGHYVGHDEPSVKFISSLKGSGNTMTYNMRLPHDPKAAPTSSGSVVDYGELSVAPWFGLPICDSLSFPQGTCKADSDGNNPNVAGSAFMELQFYPPGFTPFTDSSACSATQWCSALNIDSLACTSSGSCDNNCIEPVNFSFLQTNGVPPGPPAPQDPNVFTFLGNSKTLKMNPGDVLQVSVTDPSSGLKATIKDLTTHKTGFIQASAKNGFADTVQSTCAGVKHTFHAEYSTAKKGNQVPWADLEGGVLMQQEIGHGEVCSSVTNKLGVSQTFGDGTTYKDPNMFQTCNGGLEGKNAKGEGPCNTSTGACQHSTTEGKNGPVACPNPNFFTSTDLCEFADGFCANKGTRTATINGKAAKESYRVPFCFQNEFQNGDLDWDGNSYVQDWPNGSKNFPQTFRYAGPFTHGHTYSQIQYQTDAPASEQLCNVATGVGCVIKPIGSKFYPYWSMTNKQAISGLSKKGTCIWNFGNYNVKGVTTSTFGKDAQYGTPDLARFGGTVISKVFSNPANAKGCK